MERHKIFLIYVVLHPFVNTINIVILQTSCKAVAVLLHYATLASLAWMLVEGIVLYIKVIKVYGGESVRLRYFFIAAWGTFYV